MRAQAPSTSVEQLAVPQGRSITIDTEGLIRVAVGDSKVLGATPVGTRQLIITGRLPGRTSLLIWTETGRHDYEITVAEVTLDQVAVTLRETLAEANVRVDTVGRSLVIHGTVADQTRSNRIAGILGRFADFAKDQKYSIVNAVTVSSPLGDLQASLARTADARDVKVDYDTKGNAYVSGRVRDRAAAQTVLQQVRSLSGASLASDGKVYDRLVLDSLQQIDTKVYVLEVTKTALQHLGIRLQSATLSSTGQIQYGDPLFPTFDAPNLGNPTNPDANSLNPRNLIRTTFLAPTLDALLRDGGTRVLSQPSLVAMPGTTANFLVGGEIPYIVPTGVNEVTIAFKQYGVSLNLTPTILPDGEVETVVSPEISDLDYGNQVSVLGYTLPAFTTSRLTTDVVTRDGESIVLGGMLRHQSLRTIDKVPGLSAIPILGKLFTSTSYQNNDTDIVFVMTPQVITR